MDKIRLKGNKKSAISPIIATLLLILIAIAAGVVVYVYVLGYARSQTGAPPTGTGSMNAQTTVGSVANNRLTLYVQNTGGTSLVLGTDNGGTPSGYYVTGGSLSSVPLKYQVLASASLTGTGAISALTSAVGNCPATTSYVCITEVSSTQTELVVGKTTTAVTLTVIAFGQTHTVTTSTTGQAVEAAPVTLPTGVTVASDFALNFDTSGAAISSQTGYACTLLGTSGALTISPSTTVELDFTPSSGSIISGPSYSVQITAADGTSMSATVSAH